MSRVLIFTDDRKFGESSEHSLRRFSHAVQRSSLTGFDAERARDFGAEVIVLDAPGNGAAYSLRQRLLRDRVLASLPLVVVTESHAEAEMLAAQAMVSRAVEDSSLHQIIEHLAHFGSGMAT